MIEDVKWTDGSPASPPPLPHLHRGHTLEHNLLWAVDLTTPPSKAVLVALGEATDDPAQAATLLYLGSRDGRNAYKADISEGRPSVPQLLARYSACKPAVGRLLELLGPLRPRQYSLSNSKRVANGGAETLECAYHVVEYETHWGAHGGVATSWLEREVQRQEDGVSTRANGAAAAPNGAEAQPQRYFPVSLRPTTGFRPPDDASKPVIMVGPGTGVAPFRGFLQHRRSQAQGGASLGESWLFFGNWRSDWDFLYQSDFEGFKGDGTLSHLELAWSRAQEDKVQLHLPIAAPLLAAAVADFVAALRCEAEQWAAPHCCSSCDRLSDSQLWMPNWAIMSNAGGLEC